MKLMLGDCLERMKEIPDGSVDLVLTDPPYGTTACKWDAVIPFEPMWAQVWRVLKLNGAAVFTASQPFTSALVMSQVDMFKYEWIWNKTRNSNPFMAKKQPLRHHESVLVFSRGSPNYLPVMTDGTEYTVSSKAGGRIASEKKAGNKRGEYTGGKQRYPKSVLDIPNKSSEAGFHPTQKPVALMEYLIRTYTNDGETVLDFTMGSGSTGVACVNTGRNFIGIERDEGYFAIAEKRIKEAEHKLL